VVGVYSSHPTAPLALHARCAALDAPAFRALEAGALRLPAMRGSIHLLPRETAHLAFRALPEPPSRTAYRLKHFGLSEARYAKLSDAVRAAADQPRTLAELGAASGAGDDVKAVTATMTREGTLARVGAEGLRSNALRYMAVELPAADAGEALAWLAGEYLRAYGPARAADFAWWAGAPAGRARRALDTVEVEELDGGLLLPAADRADFDRTRRGTRGTVDLLPKWDAYTMGHAPDGRDRLAHPDVVARCYDHRGDGNPLVLVDGAAAGTWALRPGKGIEFEVDMFDGAPTPKLRRALDARLDAVRAFLAA
jgi:hypothetical protein